MALNGDSDIACVQFFLFSFCTLAVQPLLLAQGKKSVRVVIAFPLFSSQKVIKLTGWYTINTEDKKVNNVFEF